MTVAELKRRLVGECNLYREVVKTNSVDFMMIGDGVPTGKVTRGSWPKASELFETEIGFEIRVPDDSGRVRLAYRWVR